MAGWPQLLQRRETTGAQAHLPPLPQPVSGVLVLDESLTVHSVPGGMLAHIEEPLHYLDLSGVQAHSLDEYGARPELWAGLAKLYASNCGLATLGASARHLARIRYLYLDRNRLPEQELRTLLELVPSGHLEALDLTGNPGCVDALLAELRRMHTAGQGPLAPRAFLNGARL